MLKFFVFLSDGDKESTTKGKIWYWDLLIKRTYTSSMIYCSKSGVTNMVSVKNSIVITRLLYVESVTKWPRYKD